MNSKDLKHASRRSFFRQIFVATGVLATAPFVRIQNAWSALVDEKNALAIALNYVADATKSKHKNYKKGQDCSTCQFYTADANAKQGKCALIPTGEVTAAGWCQSYSEKPGAKKANKKG